MLTPATGVFIAAIALANQAQGHHWPQQIAATALARHSGSDRTEVAANFPVMKATPSSAATALTNHGSGVANTGRSSSGPAVSTLGDREIMVVDPGRPSPTVANDSTQIMKVHPSAGPTAGGPGSNRQIMQVNPSAGPTAGGPGSNRQIMLVNPSAGPTVGGPGSNRQIMQVNPSAGPTVGGPGSNRQIMQVNPSAGPTAGGPGSNPQIMQVNPPAGPNSGTTGPESTVPNIQHRWEVTEMPPPDLKGTESQ